VFYDTTRSTPILDDPSQYEMTILRFSLPSSFVELFFFEVGKPHLMTLEYNGSSVTKDLSNFVAVIDNPPLSEHYVFNYQQYVDGVNLAMAEARADLLVLQPGLPAVGSPTMLLNNATGLFSFRADQTWSDPLDTVKYSDATAKLYFNYQALRLFQTVPTYKNINDPILNEQIIFRDMGNNTGVAGTYEMTSEADTRGLWNSITQIAFDSSIPVEAEILPGSKANSRRILTDFEPDRSAPPNRSAFQFIPTGERRWYSMRSSTPMHRIDVNPRWVDVEGRSWPFFMGQGDYFSIKILFRKKAYARPGVAPAYFDQPESRF
jgi:hypothetical protein